MEETKNEVTALPSDDTKLSKCNFFMFPLGTLGRDFLYNFFNGYLLSFCVLTKHPNKRKASPSTTSLTKLRPTIKTATTDKSTTTKIFENALDCRAHFYFIKPAYYMVIFNAFDRVKVLQLFEIHANYLFEKQNN